MSSPVLRVVYSRGEDGYIVAECPQLPGCMSQGKTREEASKNIADAILAVLTVRMQQFVSKSGPESFEPSEDEETFRIEPELVAV